MRKAFLSQDNRHLRILRLWKDKAFKKVQLAESREAKQQARLALIFLFCLFLMADSILEGMCIGKPELWGQIVEDMPAVNMFCAKYNVHLVDVSVTDESGFSEPAYSFDDGLGRYTLAGIMDSL